MPEGALESLSIGRCGRWLRHAAGPGFALVACDADGSPVWNSGPEPDDMLREALATLARDARPTSAASGMVRRHLNGSGRLYGMPVAGSAGELLGWLAALPLEPHREIPVGDLERLAEALEDAAATLQDEHRARFELDSLAGELAERYEELHLVYDIDRHLQGREVSADVFQKVVETCAEQMGADVAALVCPAENLVVSATRLSKPIHNLDLVLVEMRGDLFRFLHASRAALVLNAETDPRRAYIFTDMPYKILACPVLQESQVTAMLVLLRHDHRADFANSDRRLGEITAHQLSSLLHMQRLLQEMRKFTEQMGAALIEAVEAKDPYTRGHSERVHRISVDLGRAMGLDPKDLENLFWASLLHDVGKIGIPDAVLCKPGRLTEDEYTFIMVHPERSYEILRHIDRLRDALPGARHHQEKYDGTGYPMGLKGSNIPLHARIIAVADTYDSITSSRAYRPGRSHEAAMKEIERVSGTQLDPDIVEVFKRLCAGEPEWLHGFSIRRDVAAVGA